MRLNFSIYFLTTVFTFFTSLASRHVLCLKLVPNKGVPGVVTNRVLNTCGISSTFSFRKCPLCSSSDEKKKQICTSFSKEEARFAVFQSSGLSINVEDISYAEISEENSESLYVCKNTKFRYEIIVDQIFIKYETKWKNMFPCPNCQVSFSAGGKPYKIPMRGIFISKGDEKNTAFVFEITRKNDENLPSPTFYVTGLDYENE